MRPIDEIVPPRLTVVHEKAVPRFGNPEQRRVNAAARLKRRKRRPKPAVRKVRLTILRTPAQQQARFEQLRRLHAQLVSKADITPGSDGAA